MPAPILLLTRPAAQSEAFAAQLRAEGALFEEVIAPLSEIAPLAWDEKAADKAATLIFTSANAPRFAARLAPRETWCVGEATAQAARHYGFTAKASQGDAVALLADLRATPPRGPVVHLHGRHLARDLEAELKAEFAALGIEISAQPVYEAVLCDWPEGLLARLKREAADREIIAPLFSPRAAAAFDSRWREDIPVKILAISQAAAAKLRPSLRACAEIAPNPSAMALSLLPHLKPLP